MVGRTAKLAESFLVVLIQAVLSTTLLAKTELKNLSEPLPEASLETAIKEISGIAVIDDKIALLPEGKALILSVNWSPSGKTRETAFGPIEAQTRRTLIATLGGTDLVGADYINRQTGSRWLALDGTEVSVREISTPEFNEVSKRSVAWDLIKPPSDRGGEPTRVETVELRARFKKSWLKTPGRKIAGWARRKGNEKHEGIASYLLATKIPGFPVIEMRCGQGEEPSSCLMTRACFVDGAGDLHSSAITGIGFSAKSKRVFIGDSKGRKVHVFRFESCFHIVKVGELALPEKLKKLSNVFVDQADRLWLTTEAPDDYLNASVYYWPLDVVYR